MSSPIDRLYRLAAFGPGANIHGSSATFGYVLLRARKILAGAESASAQERATLCEELDALRDNLAQRQDMLRAIHDELAAGDVS